MNITKVEVYGLNESIVASGYPMKASIDSNIQSPTELDFNRAFKLGKAKSGSGHDCMLKGVVLQYDITMNHVMLPQFLRYHFHDIVSSQSKMHRITQMDLKSSCDKYVRQEIIEIVQNMIEEYLECVEWNKTQPMEKQITKEEMSKRYEKIMSNLPMGLELTMRVSSNYLQEKSKYIQRHNHKMSFWKEYCAWLETLPYFVELTGIERKFTKGE